MKYNNKLIISLVVIHSLTSSLAFANASTSDKALTVSREELILNYLMQAELAASRNLFPEALDNYLKLAELTKNPEIAGIAAEYALELRDAPKALRSVELWAENDPENLEAQLIAVSLYIDKDTSKASTFLENAFKINVAGIEEHLVTILYKISDIGRSNLTKITKDLAEIKKDDLNIQLSIANIFANQLMIEEAKVYLDRSFKLSKNSTNAMQLQAKVIRHETGSDTKALEYLKSKVSKYSDDFMLREFYTNALIDNGNNSEAVEQLKILSKNKEFGADAAIQLGEFYLANSDYKNANTYFQVAVNNPATKDLAYYDLGQVSEYKNNNKEAIEWYTKIDPSSEHQTNGYLRAAFLYSSHKDYDNALNLLQNSNPKNFNEQKQILLTQIDLLIDLKDFDEANNTASHVLSIIPDDIDFLYARSLVRNNLQQFKPAEEDLLLVIKLEPNHANALNALAYTVGNQPGRFNQAMVYIEKALALAPNNPAFMDSKGWLLFKDGKVEQSLAILHEAYKLSQEAMIAAHYGEVLWTSGKQGDAKKVWSKALATHNNAAELTETLTKYNLTLKDL